MEIQQKSTCIHLLLPGRCQLGGRAISHQGARCGRSDAKQQDKADKNSAVQFIAKTSACIALSHETNAAATECRLVYAVFVRFSNIYEKCL